MWQEFRNNGQLTTLKDRDHQINILGPIPLPRVVGNREILLHWYPFTRITDVDRMNYPIDRVLEVETGRFRENLVSHLAVNSLLTYGPFDSSEAPMVRVHSSCMTGDVFGSMRCDCNSQLETSFSKIVDAGVGAVVYMAGHEGRGIGLWAKGAAYLLQDQGFDTYCANRQLKLPEDCRDFTDAALVLRHYIKPDTGIRLLTNNPAKSDALEKLGVKVLERLPLLTSISKHNRKYLLAKANYGHVFQNFQSKAM